MATHAVEDYLRTLYELRDGRHPVRMGRIAEALDVQPPSVTGMVHKMAELGLVTYQPYQGVSLTRLGLQQARDLSERHRLVSRYLIEVLDIEEERASNEADLLEHAVSQRLAQRLEDALEGREPSSEEMARQPAITKHRSGRKHPVKENQ